MGLKIEVNQKVGEKIKEKWFKGIIKKSLKELKVKNPGEISIAIVGDEDIRELNKSYRDIDRVTDVLSFNLEKPLLGEIVISHSQAQRQAEEKGHSLEKEMLVLLVHGLLHLLGYNHEKQGEAEEMEIMEKKILNRLN